MATFKICASPDPALALTNCVFVNPADAPGLQAPAGSSSAPANNYVMVKNIVYSFQSSPKISPGCIGLNNVQRGVCNVSQNEPVTVSIYVPKSDNAYLSSLRLQVDFLAKNKKVAERFEVDDIRKQITSMFVNQIFTPGQKFVLDFRGNNLELKVNSIDTVNLKQLASLGTDTGDSAPESSSSSEQYGILMQNTDVSIEKAPSSTISLSGAARMGGGMSVFKPDWKFEGMGIGGLDTEFGNIFRRAFASRMWPPSVVSKMGMDPVKGILLYGPPGTGKTLLARQIGKMLNGKEPKIVNGPEILNKFVGQSEENIRNLFKDAELEYEARGDDSDLHIIIFDELDAICKQRGARGDSTGVGDTVVNQLLSKMDGVKQINNVIVIGMTNRKDMIDEALLRPGRLEVQVEIGLPDEPGRLQILRIHTLKMKSNNFMDEDVNLEEVAGLTKNYSGAELAGVVRAASSYAFTREVDATNISKATLKPENVKVMHADFLRAVQEVRPAFGINDEEFESSARNGIINFGPRFDMLVERVRTIIQQVKTSKRTPLISVLLEGPAGSGKSAIATSLAKESGLPYLKLISPETLVGYSEAAKCAKITKVFEDSYRSPMSVIVVDDVERLLEFVPIGPRFSNAILQTLLVLFKKAPPHGRKLLVLATTSNKRVLADMDFLEGLGATIQVPMISSPVELKAVLSELKAFDPADLSRAIAAFHAPIPVKKVILLAEMARQGEPSRNVDRFIEFISTLGLDQ
eukprot:TRINITY_DN801_c0_g1_i2.p1 TRINITY_DN801_c0_g1~~TRINITY_DN801_c0_g1_i2.p1  ORF type:complete len:747 (+),score=261.83 TRINITY_DN801_c0_g1_i2:131-2371(+)